jgi:hypothetical protein
MGRRACLCECHRTQNDDGAARLRADGVDVTDAIEAVVACERCLNAHTPALVADADPLLDESIDIVQKARAIPPLADPYAPPPLPFQPPTAWSGDEDGG